MPTSGWRVALGFLTLTALGLGLYAPSLTGPFVFDDLEIASSPLYHPSSFRELFAILLTPGVPRRVSRLTFAVNYWLGGTSPLGYHIVNVTIHAATAVLLALYCRLLLQRLPSEHPLRSASGTLVWAGAFVWFVHPIHTQAVSYVWQRFTGLSAFFYLGSLDLFLYASSRAGGWRIAAYAGSFLSGLLALGAKENAATLPLFVLLTVLAFPVGANQGARRNTVAVAAALAVFLLVSAAWLGPHFGGMIEADYRRRGFSMAERLLTEARVVFHYLGLLVFPHPSRLNLDYDFPLSRSLFSPPTTALCVAAIAGVLLVLPWVKDRLFVFAVLWFFGHLAIESTVIPLDLVYEHRVYLPSAVPVALTCVAILVHVPRRAARLGLGAGVLLFAVWTFQRNGVWADPVRLWSDNAMKSPGKARVHANLGRAYLSRASAPGTQQGAADYENARHSLLRALQLDPTLVAAYHNLAAVHLYHLQQPAQARLLVEQAIRLEPTVEAYVNLGSACFAQGDFGAAAESFATALRLAGATSDPAVIAGIQDALTQARHAEAR